MNVLGLRVLPGDPATEMTKEYYANAGKPAGILINLGTSQYQCAALALARQCTPAALYCALMSTGAAPLLSCQHVRHHAKHPGGVHARAWGWQATGGARSSTAPPAHPRRRASPLPYDPSPPPPLLFAAS